MIESTSVLLQLYAKEQAIKKLTGRPYSYKQTRALIREQEHLAAKAEALEKEHLESLERLVSSPDENTQSGWGNLIEIEDLDDIVKKSQSYRDFIFGVVEKLEVYKSNPSAQNIKATANRVLEMISPMTQTDPRVLTLVDEIVRKASKYHDVSSAIELVENSEHREILHSIITILVEGLQIPVVSSLDGKSGMTLFSQAREVGNPRQ